MSSSVPCEYNLFFSLFFSPQAAQKNVASFVSLDLSFEREKNWTVLVPFHAQLNWNVQCDLHTVESQARAHTHKFLVKWRMQFFFPFLFSPEYSGGYRKKKSELITYEISNKVILHLIDRLGQYTYTISFLYRNTVWAAVECRVWMTPNLCPGRQ